jgi:hypothetical protein
MNARSSTRFDWWSLGRVPPQGLVKARILAHHAAQWPTRAARANLKSVSDDSHSSLEWNAELAALITQPLPTHAGEVRVGLRLGGLALVVVRGDVVLDVIQLNGKPDHVAGTWIDAKLQALGLRPASSIRLPYAMPDHPVASGARYDLHMIERELGELSRWFSGSAVMLESVKAKLADVRPGPSPMRCRPHHFDIATLVSFDKGASETPRTIGIGLSPGDEHYAQPYIYISPSPRFDSAGLPDLPQPGRWHTEGFFGAVATGDDILALQNRGRGLLAFITGAVDVARARLEA